MASFVLVHVAIGLVNVGLDVFTKIAIPHNILPRVSFSHAADATAVIAGFLSVQTLLWEKVKVILIICDVCVIVFVRVLLWETVQVILIVCDVCVWAPNEKKRTLSF